MEEYSEDLLEGLASEDPSTNMPSLWSRQEQEDEAGFRLAWVTVSDLS